MKDYKIKTIDCMPFMNQLQNKYVHENERIEFSEVRYRGNENLISCYLNSFIIDYPKEMGKEIYNFIKMHARITVDKAILIKKITIYI